VKAIGQYIIRFLENWHLDKVRNHIFFWLFNIVVFYIFEFLYGNNLLGATISKFFTFPIIVANTYYVAYYLVPLLMQKKYLKLLFFFALGSYVFSVLYRYTMVYWIERFTNPELERDPIIDILTNFRAILGQYFLLIYISPLFFILMKSAKDAFVVKRRFMKLQKEKRITELNFLRAQVHPHFLFNTLNNIYVLALKKDKRTKDVVNQLGNMMEYMVDSSSSSLVPIQKEIDLIQTYLNLEKLRYGDRLILDFEYVIDDYETKIAPLMLMSFIENAFKHGVSGDINNPRIKISLTVSEGLLDFYIFNTKSEHKQKDEKSYKKGIGVSNVKRQLDIIYQDSYDLVIDEKENSYKVKLRLFKVANIKEPKIEMPI